jgi:hypothetical protein
LRDRLLGQIAIGIIGERHVGRGTGRAARRRVGGLAENLRAVRQHIGIIIAGEVDRGDAELGQRLEGGGAIRVGHHHAELAPVCIAGIELAVMVGIEHILQRLHVRGRGRIPHGEIELVRRGDLAAAVEINRQHAIANAGPRRAILVAIPGRVEEGRGGAELGDVDALAGEIKYDRGEARRIDCGRISIVAAERGARRVIGDVEVSVRDVVQASE